VPSQLGSLMCALDAFGCNFVNVDTFLLIDACTAELASYGSCSACVADVDDDTCDTCEKTSCCSQRKAMFGDASVLEWSVCAYQCQDAACIESCGNAHPGAEAKAQAYAECTSSACPSC
jgi:hypothetical protein